MKYERRELFDTIAEYEKLALAGRRYPDHRVNLLFNDLKKRYLSACADWTKDRYDIVKAKRAQGIAHMFQTALTRAEKVIAIDSAMFFIHDSGHAVCEMFALNYEDVDDLEDIRQRTYERLQSLFEQKYHNPRRKNPIYGDSPSFMYLQRHSFEDDFRRLNWVLNEYRLLATRGLNYPTERVNRLFNELSERIDEGEAWTGKLEYEFREAKSRADKVIAIDHLMHLAHNNGSVLTSLYGFFPNDANGVRSEERTNAAVGFEHEIAQLLTRLAQNPRKIYHGTPEAVLTAKHLLSGWDSGIHFGTFKQALSVAQEKARLYPDPEEEAAAYDPKGEQLRMPLPFVLPARLMAKRIKRIEDQGDNDRWFKAINEAKAEGYDGIVYLNRYEGIPRDRMAKRMLRYGYELHTNYVPATMVDEMADKEFKSIFPEARDSYVIFDTKSIKALNPRRRR